jgi:hypothetical protein
MSTTTYTEEELNRKVHKLIQQAEHAGTSPEEAQSFMGKAQQLISQYMLDELVIRGLDPNSDELVTEYVDNYGKFYNGWGDLLAGVAAANDCKVVWCHGEYWLYERVNGSKTHSAARKIAVGEKGPVKNPNYMKTGGVITVSGFQSDVRNVLGLFASLKVQAESAFLQDEKPAGIHGTSWKHSWLDGYGRRIRARLAQAKHEAVAEKKAAMEEAEEGSSDNLPVLVAQKKDRVHEYYDKYWGKLTNRTRSSATSYSGVSAGARAADRADLGGGRLGQTRGLPR